MFLPLTRVSLRALLALLLCLPLAVQAQLLLTQAATPTTENFDGLKPATLVGTKATLPTGFVLNTVTPTYGDATNLTTTTQSTTYQNGFTTGGSYNFGSGGTSAATATDRALGFLSSSGYALPGHIMLAIKNTTGATITGLTINFDLEQYRANKQDVDWKFYSSLDGSAWTSQTDGDQFFPMASASAYNFTPQGTAKTVVLSGLSLANNATYYLRWTMQYGGTSTSGNGQAIGLDNLVLTPTLAGTPPTASITTTASFYASPYCLTSTTGSAAFPVGFTTTGTIPGTTFQAQLSNATGTFPTDLTTNIIGSGPSSPLAASIPANTPSGTGYRIRVLNGSIIGSDNSNNLSITLAPATNPVAVAPSADQTFAVGASGTTLTATPAVPSTYAWFYGTSATGPFSTALSGATSSTYQPQSSDFTAGPGTYYVVAQATSDCGNVVGTSGPIKITITPTSAGTTVSVTLLPDFGSIAVGSTSSARSFTVSATGLTDALTITPPPGFEIRVGATAFACCAIVLAAPGGTVPSTQVDIRFAPLAAQVYTAQLTLTSPGVAEQEVAVSGTGIAPSYPATLTTTAPTAITTTTATAGGTISSNGGSAVTAYGVVWGTAPEPTIAVSHTTDGSGTATFTSSLTGLRPGTHYYVRSYATSAVGTTYGDPYAFTTVAVPPADEPSASSTLTASAVRTNRLLLTFTGGTGAKHLVLAHLNGVVDQDPSDATTYSASATFGQGSVLGSDADNFVLFAGVGDTVTVFGIRPNTPYSFAVYDYNDNNTVYAENYRTSDPGTLSLTTPPLPPTLLLQEDFAYPVGSLLTANNWAAHSGAGTKSITVTSGNLTYSGYSTGTGNSAALTASGEDVNRQFASIYARTPVYLSFLVSVSNASTSGDYFLHLGTTVLSSNFRGRVFVRKSAAGGLQFGVSGSAAGTTAAPASYTTTDYAFNTTYLVLLKYSYDETGNTTELYVNPATSGTAYRITATPDLSVTEPASSSPTDIGTVALRQGSNSPALTVDALTVATAFPLATTGPLPVTLTDFTAQLSGQKVQVQWHTASELNADRFEVERSGDATTFTRLTSVPAAGTSATAHAYAYTDAALPLGLSTVYYRLRQVDVDGTSTYSTVRAVALTPATAGLALFPNPTRSATTLTGASPNASVQVFDALGRTLTTVTADASGAAQLTLPTGLTPGVYIVRTGTQALRLLLE